MGAARPARCAVAARPRGASSVCGAPLAAASVPPRQRERARASRLLHAAASSDQTAPNTSRRGPPTPPEARLTVQPMRANGVSAPGVCSSLDVQRAIRSLESRLTARIEGIMILLHVPGHRAHAAGHTSLAFACAAAAAPCGCITRGRSTQNAVDAAVLLRHTGNRRCRRESMQRGGCGHGIQP
ncbi:MAG: hypothetical protein J3K34DRAFT_228463 [Monoraphidium minutum]|nr:MAG: hypothetical protein J3K34DRAFT_228463 [Monoraphidium minutum]